MILFFDTETTGFGRRDRIVSVAAVLDLQGSIEASMNCVVRPDGFDIAPESVHGITHEHALTVGVPIADVLATFKGFLSRATRCVAFNASFDVRMLSQEYERLGPVPAFPDVFCAMRSSTGVCKLLGSRGPKWPTLDEAHRILVGEPLSKHHDAMEDVLACRRIYRKLQP